MAWKQRLKEWTYEMFAGAWTTTTSRYPIGTNVYSRDWDVLVILDACRVDVLREISHQYDFIEEVNSIWSVGSNSAEWIAQTFTNKHIDDIRDTALITSNANVSRVIRDRKMPPHLLNALGAIPNWNVVEPETFGKIEEVWKYASTEPGPVPPRPMTDEAIRTARSESYDRMIIHYTQPHAPYIRDYCEEESESVTPPLDRPHERLAEGEANLNEVWDAYRREVEWVLDEVSFLRENINADRLVITADHGEGFGDSGFVYEHPYGIPHPAVKRVPWIVTDASDNQEYEPESKQRKEPSGDVEEQLRKLGYV